MDYSTLLVNYEDPEFVDTFEDTKLETIANNSVFSKYAQQYLTIEGLSFLYENMDSIQRGPTEDGCLIILDKLQKIAPISFDERGILYFSKKSIIFHILISKISTSLIFSKFRQQIHEKDLRKILKNVVLNTFGLDYEPTYFQVRSFYEILKSHGYQGEFLDE